MYPSCRNFLNRPYSQRAAHRRARLLSHFVCQNAHKRMMHVFTHVQIMRVYNFLPFWGVHSFSACFQTQNAGQEMCLYVRCAL